MRYVVNLNDVNHYDVKIVGGKNASTGEMLQHLSKKGILIPDGYATTADAFKKFLSQQQLNQKIQRLLSSFKHNDLRSLNKASKIIQRWIIATPLFDVLEKELKTAYSKMKNASVAVRSSATAEDLTTASFAGAQETFLNVKGTKNLLTAVKRVYASLFTARAIAYRKEKGFDHTDIALSVGIQPMVRSDKGISGVMFTLDTESGFDQIVLITASYGLGETIVQGQVNPDEFVVSKPLLEKNKFSILHRRLGEKAVKMIYTKDSIKKIAVKSSDRFRFCISDKEIQSLARQALIIEKHYGKPMDIEWAKDGVTGKLYIVQARPETVRSQLPASGQIARYRLTKKSKIIVEGQSIGQHIGRGKAKIISNPKQIEAFKKGEVLVTDMTDPDWEPIMKTASAIVTNRGGRTCHAAIVARELGIPAVIGCQNATKLIKNNQAITVSCAEGHIGYVYEGELPFTINKISIKKLPKLPIKLCMNVGNPEKAFAYRFLPNDGVGLARLEFIISDIGLHPNALLNFKQLPKKLQQEIKLKTAGYPTPIEFYIEKLREGIATIAAAFYPKEVIFRFSDFKSNEYANLLGGHLFEPIEENPMLGFRGAARYNDAHFRQSFTLECEAFKRVRNDMGLTNAQLMIPFVRTVNELRDTIRNIKHQGLVRRKNNLKIYMMCEIPSNVVLAEEFLKYVDGFSIGSNDLTQLMLGLDRDSTIVAPLFDEQNEAIKRLLHLVIKTCNMHKKYIGICGQAPSDHPDFAVWLMKEGIQAISLSPDSVIDTWLLLANKLKK